ncbi:MAG: GNAT family N-acetyltransferase [Bacteroidota bacterium]|nr:GNAT family N-acetyltransferase [Bacteroidota bacterium]
MNVEKEIQNNLFAFYKLVASEASLNFFHGDDYKWVNSIPWPNFIFDENPNKIEKIIKEVADKKNKEIPSFWITKNTHNNLKFQHLLSDANFLKVMTWPGMAIDLSKNSFDKPKLKVTQVKTKEQLKEWFKVIDLSFFYKRSSEEEIFIKIFNSQKVVLYIGYHNSVAVATSLMFSNNKSAGLYMIASLPEYRNKGFGREITKIALVDAKNSGHRIAVLQATKDAFEMYKKIGFKEYCNFDIYWNPEKDEI